MSATATGAVAVERVIVEPQPAHLKRIRSSTPTPKGDVKLDLSFDVHILDLLLFLQIW